MKSLVLFLLISLSFIHTNAQVFGVESILVSGNDDKRINLIILSEGYQSSEFPDFITDATNFTNSMFSQSPFLEYANYFNVYAIKVPSNKSGADHPGTATDVVEPETPVIYVDTYFNATFDAYGFHRALFYEIDGNYANNTEAKINSVLADNFPEYDQTIILVNTDIYGGTGGIFPMASTAPSANEIAIHELGHSMFNLKDEYYPGDIYFAEAINMTQESDNLLVRWENWVGEKNIGVHPYSGSSIATTWYKPQTGNNCKMEYLGVPFCSVCKEGIVEKIHALVSPIDSYTPANTAIDNPTFPLDFHLNLIKPVPTNTLKSTWTLNATAFANDLDDVSVLETDLNAGMNTLTAVINDDSPFLRVDNHETLHIYTVTWNIDNTTLGIHDITSEANNFDIKVFPNPVSDIINFSFESSFRMDLKLDIVSIDGKKTHSYKLINSDIFQVDMSPLSQGIYLAKFYNNNALIATKKLVKN
jgi:hypothetical protein